MEKNILIITKVPEVSLLFKNLGYNPITVANPAVVNKMLAGKKYGFVVIGPPFSEENKSLKVEHERVFWVSQPSDVQEIVRNMEKEEEEKMLQEIRDTQKEPEKPKKEAESKADASEVQVKENQKTGLKKKTETNYSELHDKILIISCTPYTFEQFRAVSTFKATNIFSAIRKMNMHPEIEIVVADVFIPKKLAQTLKEKGILLYHFRTDVLSLHDVYLNYKTSKMNFK